MSEALLQLGLQRETVAIVQIFLDALTIARHSDLVALVPRICLRDGQSAGHGLAGFNVPVTTPDLTIIVMWRPRLDADSAHNWLNQFKDHLTKAPVGSQRQDKIFAYECKDYCIRMQGHLRIMTCGRQ